MTDVTGIETGRLKLRQWLPGDYASFAALNADPEVMAYFPAVLDAAESQDYAYRIEALIEKNGWGLWAAEVKNTHSFIGFVGLHQPGVDLPFTPCVEIGWRLARQHWGKGYATEAATAALGFAFETLELQEVVSFTAELNAPSRRVMAKLNMVNPENSPVGHEMIYLLLYGSTNAYSGMVSLCNQQAYSVLRWFWHVVKNLSPANVATATLLDEKSFTPHQSSPQFPNTGEISGLIHSRTLTIPCYPLATDCESMCSMS